MKHSSLKTLLVLSIAAGVITAHAQEGMVPAPKELDAMAWQVGTWNADIKWTMPGMEGDGKIQWVVTREATCYKSVGTMEMGGMKSTETQYFGWDDAKKKYWSYTFTDYGTVPRIEWGTIEGDKTIFLSEPWPMMGQAMESRATMTKKSDKEMHFVLEMKQGTSWAKMGEGTFKKK